MPLDPSIYTQMPAQVPQWDPMKAYEQIARLRVLQQNQIGLEQERQQRAAEIAAQTQEMQLKTALQQHGQDVLTRAKALYDQFSSDDPATGQALLASGGDPEIMQQAYSYWEAHHKAGDTIKAAITGDRVNAAKLIQASTPQGQPYDPASVIAAMHLDHRNTEPEDPPEIQALYTQGLQDPKALQQIVDYWAAGGPGAKPEDKVLKSDESWMQKLPGQPATTVAVGPPKAPEPAKGTLPEQYGAAMEAIRQAKAAGQPTDDLVAKANTLLQSMTQAKIAGEDPQQTALLNALHQANIQNALNAPQLAATTRRDRSYDESTRQLNELRKPVADQLDRLGRLTTSINQMTPQADAVIAPELLTVMAGGAGSGLRMNDAEISRIVGGRSAWEDLKARLNKWSVDPSQALSVTDDQHKQMRALVSEVQRKAQEKLGILNQAGQDLIDAPDVETHRRVLQGARQSLTEAAVSAAPTTAAPVKPGNVRVVGPNGERGQMPKDKVPAGWQIVNP